MSAFSITINAGPNELFAASAFDRQIGDTVLVDTPSGEIDGVITSAVVAHDRRSARITIDTPNGVVTIRELKDWSVGFQ